MLVRSRFSPLAVSKRAKGNQPNSNSIIRHSGNSVRSCGLLVGRSREEGNDDRPRWRLAQFAAGRNRLGLSCVVFVREFAAASYGVPFVGSVVVAYSWLLCLACCCRILNAAFLNRDDSIGNKQRRSSELIFPFPKLLVRSCGS